MKEPASQNPDKALVAYQKSALSFFYPSLLNFFAIAAGLSLSVMGGFALSSNYVLKVYLDAHPLGGNAVWSTTVSILAAAAIVGLCAFLTLRAVKGKFYPLVVMSVLYLADLGYAIALFFPIYGQVSPAIGGVSIGVHALFLALFSLSIVKYAKLSRLLKRADPINE